LLGGVARESTGDAIVSGNFKPSSVSNNKHQIGEEIKGVLMFVGAIWAVHVLDIFLPLGEYLALVPRYLSGIFGIGAMTFLHADFGHLIANTFPLIVLLTLLAGSRANSWQTVASIATLGGLLLWLFGRNGSDTQIVSHVGASLLVFGLVTFFLAAAWFEKRLVPMLIAVVVGFMYGWSTLTGMLPISRGVSWDGHLCGAIAGVMVAWLQTGFKRHEISHASDVL
jgi:membrane associated rhomboid family serine protease